MQRYIKPTLDLHTLILSVQIAPLNCVVTIRLVQAPRSSGLPLPATFVEFWLLVDRLVLVEFVTLLHWFEASKCK
jgi:hypothetical protein